MTLAKGHYITLKDGMLDSTASVYPTTLADVSALFEMVAADPHGNNLVLHFHGGLVDATSGASTAESLLNLYQSLAVYQIFFIWETGLLDVLSTNYQQIFSEDFFQQLLHLVLQFAQAKVTQNANAVAGGSGGSGSGRLKLPTDVEITRKMPKPPTQGSDGGTTLPVNDPQPQPYPFADIDVHTLTPNDRLNEVEKEQFIEALKGNAQLQGTVQTIDTSRIPINTTLAPQGTKIQQIRGSSKSLISPDILSANGTDGAGTTGSTGTQSLGNAFFTGVIIPQAVTVLTRVIDRFINKRDHGLYATVIEEILRAFYLANIGKNIWVDIKNEVTKAFGNDDPQRGGTAFLHVLQAYYASNPNPRPHITLVGHSAGSIYICEFLRQADQFLPPDITFDIVLLAPACTFKLLSATVQACKARIEAIRIFGMSDAVEQADVIVPFIYTHSLLYLISGLFEDDDADTPLVGMQRYYSDATTYTMQEVQALCTYLNSPQKELVWSLASGKDGLSSSVTRHGNFYSDTLTLQSLQYILLRGF